MKDYLKMTLHIFFMGAMVTFLLSVWVKLFVVFYHFDLIPGFHIPGCWK